MVSTDLVMKVIMVILGGGSCCGDDDVMNKHGVVVGHLGGDEGGVGDQGKWMRG